MSIKKLLLAPLAILIVYFAFYPSPIDPIAHNFPRMEMADNDRLQDIEILFPRVCRGCEDISFDGSGNLYTGHKDGRLLRFPLDGGDRLTEIVSFTGRPLGLEVLGDSLAWVCVEQEGLARVDLRNQTYTIVSTGYDDTLFQLIDYLDVAADGDVYFTDASNRYSDEELQFDVLAGRPNGALYRYDAATGETERLIDHLYFANGVVAAPDESYVLVAETSAFRVKKHWLKGANAGTTEVFIEGLPGWPDGISRGTDGLLYVTLISPRTPLHDFILPRPWTRRLVTKLPLALWPKPVKGNRILAFDEAGTLVHDWMDGDPTFSSISSVERVGDVLYFGTLDEAGIGRWKVR